MKSLIMALGKLLEYPVTDDNVDNNDTVLEVLKMAEARLNAYTGRQMKGGKGRAAKQLTVLQTIEWV